MLAAMSCQHRLEMARLNALVVLYRKTLEEAGIQPPSIDGAEALDRFQSAFMAAGIHDPLQHPELLAETWRS